MRETVGLFGKIPAQGDFYRANVAAPAAQALIAWLQDAIEPVYAHRLALPAEPVRFLFRAAAGGSVLVGVLAASEDRVGRPFPLCAFAAMPSGAVQGRFPAVPAAHRPFLEGAEALLLEAGRLDGAALAARARALPLPDPAALSAAGAELAADATRDLAADLELRLFSDLPRGGLAYALTTFRAGVAASLGRRGPPQPVALECPADWDHERWAWLELARRAEPGATPTACWWTPGVPGRLLLAMGGVPTGLLARLCDPRRSDPRVWPVHGGQERAIAAAVAGLSAELRRALDAPETTLEALLTAAAGAGGGRP